MLFLHMDAMMIDFRKKEAIFLEKCIIISLHFLSFSLHVKS